MTIPLCMWLRSFLVILLGLAMLSLGVFFGAIGLGMLFLYEGFVLPIGLLLWGLVMAPAGLALVRLPKKLGWRNVFSDNWSGLFRRFAPAVHTATMRSRSLVTGNGDSRTNEPFMDTKSGHGIARPRRRTLFKFGFIAVIVVTSLMILGGFFIDPGWPLGTGYGGYIRRLKNRPRRPYDISEVQAHAYIVGKDGNQLRYTTDVLRVIEGRQRFRFPGATVTYACKNPEKAKISDFNGDGCVLRYGMTVKVDPYGQFVLISDDPADIPANIRLSR